MTRHELRAAWPLTWDVTGNTAVGYLPDVVSLRVTVRPEGEGYHALMHTQSATIVSAKEATAAAAVTTLKRRLDRLERLCKKMLEAA